MGCRMKSLLAPAAFLVMSIAGTWATAEEARPISPAQLQKIIKSRRRHRRQGGIPAADGARPGNFGRPEPEASRHCRRDRR